MSAFFKDRENWKQMVDLEQQELEKIINESNLEHEKRLKNQEKTVDLSNYKPNYRIQAMQLISDTMECINCGCDDTRILEINHKNGDGNLERKTTYPKGRGFYKAIVERKRSVEDLEIVCKICNWIHYIRFKFGINGHKIVFDPTIP